MKAPFLRKNLIVSFMQGLEYNNTCVGDGGLRLVLSDGESELGVASDGEWEWG